MWFKKKNVLCDSDHNNEKARYWEFLNGVTLFVASVLEIDDAELIKIREAFNRTAVMENYNPNRINVK